MEDRYSSAFDEVRASDRFKTDMIDRMRALNTTEPQETARHSVSVPKRMRKRTPSRVRTRRAKACTSTIRPKPSAPTKMAWWV